ncbi:hypothetical protein FRB93_009216 [Tulasnella sp. JGI-2019a]|nr:hypothetical protein FRB93_009216 [Tulasnella sp. JGI-2019a]
MSSGEALNGINDGDFRVLTGLADSEITKRKKVTRACDICRRKRIRCDAHSKPNMEKCTHCSSHKLDCTFVESAKKRSPPKSDATMSTPSGPTLPSDLLFRYIKDLEERIDLLEKLLRRVAPDINIDVDVGPSFDMQTWETVKGKSLFSHAPWAPATQISAASSELHATLFTTAPKDLRGRFSSPAPLSIGSGSSPAQDDLEPSDDDTNLTRNDGTVGDRLEERIEKLSLGDTAEKKFLGKSSGISLVRAALALKDTVTGNLSTLHATRKNTEGGSRPKFWKASPWEWMAVASPAIESLRFPPPDLIRSLIDHCFNDVLPFMPVLHRPSFERQYVEEKHKTDLDFARLLLVVCSVGARTCKDMRVCMASPGGEIEWNSAGWMYFTQVYQLTKPVLASARLVDLQIMALSATYLEGTTASSSAWLINGIGVRFAEDVGAHRETVYASTHAFDNQMWRRTFWCLIQKDREISISLGRPMCINDEDIDAQLPLEVDDDGWDEAKQKWVQPVGKPSQLTFLVQHSKLMGILAQCMRTLYCINKSKIRLGFVGAEWEQDRVSELDSTLNEWLEALPDHLRWDQHMNSAFYQQAATLRIIFHYIQITIHRPFIQLSSSSRRSLSMPSLAVCTNAARSAARILEATMEMPSSPIFVLTSLLSGVVLMISIWEAQRSGLDVDTTRQVSGVQTCLNYLKRWEDRYHLSGRLYDVLRQTASISDVPLPVSPHPNSTGDTGNNQSKSTKRGREDDLYEHGSQFEPTTSGHFPSLAPQDMSNFPNRTQLRPTMVNHAPFASFSQCAQTSASLLDPNHGTQTTNSASRFALPPPPVYQWPQLEDYGSDPLSILETTWESFPLSGSGASGLGMGFQGQGLPGYDTHEVNWQELLGPLLPDGDQDILNMQPENWNGDLIHRWDWLNNVPDSTKSPSAAAHPPR